MSLKRTLLSGPACVAIVVSVALGVSGTVLAQSIPGAKAATLWGDPAAASAYDIKFVEEGAKK